MRVVRTKQKFRFLVCTYIVRIHEKIYHCDPAWPDVLGFLVSNLFEQCSFHPGWLGYIRDYTTQLYREYNQPL